MEEHIFFKFTIYLIENKVLKNNFISAFICVYHEIIWKVCDIYVRKIHKIIIQRK